MEDQDLDVDVPSPACGNIKGTAGFDDVSAEPIKHAPDASVQERAASVLLSVFPLNKVFLEDTPAEGNAERPGLRF